MNSQAIGKDSWQVLEDGLVLEGAKDYAGRQLKIGVATSALLSLFPLYQLVTLQGGYGSRFLLLVEITNLTVQAGAFAILAFLMSRRSLAAAYMALILAAPTIIASDLELMGTWTDVIFAGMFLWLGAMAIRELKRRDNVLERVAQKLANGVEPPFAIPREGDAAAMSAAI